MSGNLKPLIWKNHEKNEKDDIWPKRVIGASFVYLEDYKKYVLIGGNFNALENANKIFKINREIIDRIDKNLEDFYDLETKKIEYLQESVMNNSQNLKAIEIYVYELFPEKKWFKVSSSGRVPKARSFHKCVSFGNYIFCFGGVELGSKGDNVSLNDLYVFNIETYEWKLILCNKYPYDRTDFSWIKLNKSAILYGGVRSPSEIYYDDMWVFKYDDFDFKREPKKEVQKDYWNEITQNDGSKPGKIRAFSMEYSEVDGFIYLFGGHDSRGKNKNDLYRFDVSKSNWEVVKTKGQAPSERCYHEMSLISKDYFLVFGGIFGTFSKIDIVYNDVFLYNIVEGIWVEPVIGGIQPSPRFGFSYCSNKDFGDMQIMILGGLYKEVEKNLESKFFKVYSITENDSESTYIWNVRDIKYREEQNDENFIIQSEQSIHEYKEKTNTLEIEIRNKEIAIEDMKTQIEDFKKKIFKTHGYIDDQTQSLDEHIKELKIQKKNFEESLEFDKKITNLKLKLKFVMQRKVQKTMEFFCSNQNLFIKYYDSLKKMLNNKTNKELDNLYNKETLDAIKIKYNDRLISLKNNLESLNSKEESLSSDLHRYKKLEKNVDELFKEEIDEYKISDDSLTDI